jgi:hypothetical protein
MVHDTVADLERGLGSRADLYDFAHGFMADDVAALHRWNDAAIDVEVGAADGTGRHPNDRVARILDLRIWHLFATHVSFAVPSQRFHVATFIA